MRRLEEIKKGMKSEIQDEWITWDDIEWLIEQAEKFERIKNKMIEQIIEKNHEALKKLADS